MRRAAIHHFMNLQKRVKGFTFVELLIVLLLVSIIGGALFSALYVNRNSWYAADAQISLQEELRRAMEQICDDLRQSSSGQISLADGSAADHISLNISQGVFSNGSINWSNPIMYSLDTDPQSGTYISRDDSSGTPRHVANSVTNMGFNRTSKNVGISISAQKTTPYGHVVSANAASEVYLRN
jgi:prepilin-type N-terminal cleavage/methylation domain-containing protein